MCMVIRDEYKHMMTTFSLSLNFGLFLSKFNVRKMPAFVTFRELESLH